MMTTNITNPIDYPQLRGSLESIKYPAFVEPKLDGELNYCYMEKDVACLRNKYGKERTDFPAVTELKKAMGDRTAIFAGELVYGEGKSGDLYEFLKNKTSNGLRFVIFDIISLDGKSLTSESTLDRKEMLIELFDDKRDMLNTKVLCPAVAHSKSEVETIYLKVIKMGYEGVVIKNFHEKYISGPCNWVKMKHRDINAYKVCYIDPVKERIEVTVATINTTRPVGVKVMNNIKKLLKVGDVVNIEHQGVLPMGGLRHPVFRGKEVTP